MPPLLETNLTGFELHSRGKVRDVYTVDDYTLLIVATDRLSAFDVVFPTPITDKGRVLTQMTLFWLGIIDGIVPNHLLTANIGEYPAALRKFREQLSGRSMLVRKAEMLPVECVARGYVAGSGWKDYRSTGGICGIALPPGLRESDRLPQPIFTPASKAQSGHDENITFEQASLLVGADDARRVSELTLAIYKRASEYARTRGILIADTKFEFGYIDGTLSLGDEVLTPDSSRFWPADQYRPGGPQPSFDKQYVRDYLEAIRWNKQPPAPALPDEVATRTAEKYREAYRLLTGSALP